MKLGQSVNITTYNSTRNTFFFFFFFKNSFECVFFVSPLNDISSKVMEGVFRGYIL